MSQVYLVGGAVRDSLMGLEPKDMDLVVVGSSEKEVLEKGVTFRGVHYFPLFSTGVDFSVFRPENHDNVEIALARKESPSGRPWEIETSYSTFVTLEEDLSRRDLTVNAIAMSEDGSIIDPLGGVQDLKTRVLRHVGPAFEVDPVRVLRLLKLHARFCCTATTEGVSVAPETIQAARRVVGNGGLNVVAFERVRLELLKILENWNPQTQDLISQLGLTKPGSCSYFDALGVDFSKPAVELTSHAFFSPAAKVACLMQKIPSKEDKKKFCLDAEWVSSFELLTQLRTHVPLLSMYPYLGPESKLSIAEKLSGFKVSQALFAELAQSVGIDLDLKGKELFEAGVSRLRLDIEKLSSIKLGEVLEREGLKGKSDADSIAKIKALHLSEKLKLL